MGMLFVPAAGTKLSSEEGVSLTDIAAKGKLAQNDPEPLIIRVIITDLCEKKNR